MPQKDNSWIEYHKPPWSVDCISDGMVYFAGHRDWKYMLPFKKCWYAFAVSRALMFKESNNMHLILSY